ncbi:EAL domain, c-di-GMP-specific phosphodiesterase class I (or its enzymatically inactive variant) [Pseudomonas koreensis]|uniref:EAL domain-containing response regulator n=1 Tax=Pseudomonas koreensis TaxID=198620 RepID=UPI00087C879C|nr:EAL domain-containing response regulator [Pseudomonas koreensis]NNA64937.1 EAL domain-containing response regulator [Pseudomonas koreensis]GGK53494.1 transcriptional regulator [Pseudomonas koreensis]SDE39488.1 EAL domain, c-di-GMP-specific phosphodiesterase class I (or its enzymatically inactive variant) [Pseudomonas koreensis]
MKRKIHVRALIVDENSFQLAISVAILKRAGCDEVISARNGKFALEILKDSGYVDVAFFDLRMSDMDGLELIRVVGDYKLTPAIVISETLSADMRRAIRQITEIRGVKFIGDIAKPFNREMLYNLLQHTTKTGASVEACPTLPIPTKDELKDAIHNEQFVPYYQPKFNLETGNASSVEVLARWHHPNYGVIPPSNFLPELKKHSLLGSLLDSQLRAGLKLQRKAWQLGHPLNMAFNIEAIQLSDALFTTNVSKILTERNMPGSGLTFELTESGLLDLSAITLENLARLRILGCSLSIDDFGIGFSSLQRLCQVPFNEIKLDSDFVSSLIHDPRCNAVITSTLALGEALEMSVVVEGIETEEQRKLLLELGCKIGQGYICAKPMPENSLLMWLEERSLLKDASLIDQNNRGI